jgi:phospholipid/cholesterol/gamma-HCH transport system substrate-binding protein
VRLRTLRAAAAIAVVGLLSTGCGFAGIYDTPLPGGADLGDNPVTIHAKMADVADLVPQAAVKVNDVPIGKVSSINLSTNAAGSWVADVTMEVNRNSNLPSNSTAELKQTSLLGEKYVELNPPAAGEVQQAALRGGEDLKQSTVSHHVEAEQVLGALSLLLNNGGLEQIRTISHELQSATSGNEGGIRALLKNVNTLAGGLDRRSGDITKALDGLDELSGTLNGQKDRLAGVLDNIGPGLKTLRDQRGQLVNMLQALDNLSGVAVDTVHKSKADLVADLKTLRPTLQKLADAGDSLPKSLQLLTFPFTNQALKGIKGDYLNLYVDVDLDLTQLLSNLSRSRQTFPGPLSVPELNGLIGGKPGQQSAEAPQSGGGSLGQGGQQTPEGAGQEIGGVHGLLGELLGGGN